MKALTSMALVTTLILFGCATPTSPSSIANEFSMAPAERKAALESQARGIRTRIIELKQQVVVQEVMLTNVERRAAMSQVSLSNLPNTEILSEPAPVLALTRPEANRLTVAVRPAPIAAQVAAPVKKPPVKKKKKKVSRTENRPATTRP